MAEGVGTERMELDKPIYLLANDCNDLFQEILQGHIGDPSEAIFLVDEYHEAFTAWTSFVCVFEASDSCLDYRLRKHSSVQDVVIRLLEILRQNLYILSCNLHESQLDEVSVALAGIKDSMKSLNKLALAIRQSSRSSAVTLARNFATSNRALEDLEDLVTLALETLYPNAPESLRKQLCDTMTDRYAKLEYNAHRRNKSQARPLKRIQHDEASAKAGDQGQVPAPSEGTSRIRLDINEGGKEDTKDAGQTTQRKPLSSIDTGLLRQALGNEPAPTSQSRRTLSVYQTDSRLHEPPPPQFGEGDSHAECKWCYEVIDRSLLKGKGWSDLGRRHYKRDLKPFPCLSEACGERRPSFPSRTEWLKHMRSSHSAAWSQVLHRQNMWVCNLHVEPEGSTTYAFSAKNELERHMLLLHPSKTSLSDEDLAEFAQQQLSGDETPSLDLCPLCLFAEKSTTDTEDDKVPEAEAQCLNCVGHSNSKLAAESKKNKNEHLGRKETRVKFAEDVQPAADDAGHHTLEDGPSTPFGLEMHVAAHLQYLMALSLRFVETLDYDSEQSTNDGGSWLSGSATGSISPVDEGVGSEAWPEEEPTVPYLSDADLRHLEQLRSGEEAEITLPSSGADETWERVQFVVEKPPEEDHVLQHLGSRQGESFIVDSLRKTIEEQRLAIENTNEGHLSRAQLWWNMGQLLKELSSKTEDVADLDECTEAYREAARLLPEGDALRHAYLSMLCIRLAESYRMTRRTRDLDEAITTTEETLALAPHDIPVRAELVETLSVLFNFRYDITGEIKQLERALQISRDAIDLLSEGDARLARFNGRLGDQLTLLYWRSGTESTIAEAVDVLRKALSPVPRDDIERYTYQRSLSIGLWRRFQASGATADLEEAIRLRREAIELITLSHSNYLGDLRNLGAMLGDWYQRTSAADVLEEAIHIGRNMVALTPLGNPDAVEYMESLAARLTDRCQATGSASDLEEAVQLTYKAIDVLPEEHPSLFIYQHSLAARLTQQIFLTGSLEHREAVVLFGRRAIAGLPDDHVNLAACRNTLAFALSEMHSEMGSLASLDEAIELYNAALKHTYSPVLDRIHAGQQITRLAARFPSLMNQGAFGAGIVASTDTISLIHRLAFESLHGFDRERILNDLLEWLSDSLAIAMQEASDPVQALFLLEMCRTLLANSLEVSRNDVEALRKSHPSAAESFVRLRVELGKPMSAPMLPTTGENPWNAQSRRCHRASQELDELLGRIQDELGFPSFWSNGYLERLGDADIHGAIVILNASAIRCDAIIAHNKSTRALHLPDLRYGDIWKRLNSDSLFTEQTLEWLWDTIAGPVSANLGFQSPPSHDLPRIWWIPTGLLTNFPIHAAGYHRDNSSKSCLDLFVSSYSASVGALVSSRKSAIPSPQRREAAFVSIEDSPGFPRLAFAAREVAKLRPLCSSMGLDVVEIGNGEEVVPALSRCTLFHFAGYFKETENPLQSHLVLGDRLLTVEDILDMDLHASSPFLAYLSSCGTARTKNRAYADEGVHLAGAFRIAGFRHAIGTLGEVGDQLCVDMARYTYREIETGEMTDDSVARGLHAATRRCRDRWLNSRRATPRKGFRRDDSDENKPLEWAAFVHYGV